MSLLSFRQKENPPPARLWHMGTADNMSKCWLQMDYFDPEVNVALKACMPGPYSWHSKSKRWIFPLNWEACIGARDVATKFGAEINITDTLNDWARDERARQEAIPDVQSMELIDLPKVRVAHPRIWDAISSRPFQTVGAAFAARNRSCLIADQPGLGKTIQSIAAVIESGITGPILVVAPKAAAKLTWPQELAKWVPKDTVVVIGAHIPASQRGKQVMAASLHAGGAGGRVWIITSPNYLRVKAQTDGYGKYVYDPATKKKVIAASGEGLIELLDVEWSAVIVDESHQTLAGATGNVKKQSAQRQGLGALMVRGDGLRIALSGTPFRGKEVYVWGQFNWLRPDLYTSYWKWVEKYFDVWQDRYSMQIGRMVKPDALYAEAANVMIRRTKAEVAKDLPPKMYNDIWLDMDPKQAAAYKQMEKSASAELDGGVVMANGVLAELTRLKQFAGSTGTMVSGTFKAALPSNKFDWLLEFLDERGINKDGQHKAPEDFKFSSLPKIVVTSQFSGLIDVISDALWEEGINTYKFTGSTSDREREVIKNDWQNQPNSATRVLLLTTTAGGVSLTLDASSDVVVLDETWNPADQEQVEDRVHRLSRMHQVTIWNIRSNGTIEEAIAKSNFDRDANIKDIIDGSRGVDFARQLMKGK